MEEQCYYCGKTAIFNDLITVNGQSFIHGVCQKHFINYGKS